MHPENRIFSESLNPQNRSSTAFLRKSKAWLPSGLNPSPSTEKTEPQNGSPAIGDSPGRYLPLQPAIHAFGRAPRQTRDGTGNAGLPRIRFCLPTPGLQIFRGKLAKVSGLVRKYSLLRVETSSTTTAAGEQCRFSGRLPAQRDGIFELSITVHLSKLEQVSQRPRALRASMSGVPRPATGGSCGVPGVRFKAGVRVVELQGSHTR